MSTKEPGCVQTDDYSGNHKAKSAVLLSSLDCPFKQKPSSTQEKKSLSRLTNTKISRRKKNE